MTGDRRRGVILLVNELRTDLSLNNCAKSCRLYCLHNVVLLVDPHADRLAHKRLVHNMCKHVV